MTDTSVEAAKRRAAEQLSAVTAAMVTVGNIDAEEEAKRKKAEKEEAKRKEEEAARQAAAAEQLARETAALSLAESGDKIDSEAAAAALRILLGRSDAAGPVVDLMKKVNVEGGNVGKMRALYEALFVNPDAETPSATVPAIMKAKKNVLAANAKDRPSQLAQLIALEHLFAVTAPNRMKELPAALKALFDLDIVEDEIIIAWADRVEAGKVLGVPKDAAAAVREAVSAVVEWLQQSDEESDEEDEEDDE
jgi:translation initiation factor 5